MTLVNTATAARRPVLLSPHLDDAVFSCGEWLLDHPGTPVVTVFAGLPPAALPLTDWDHRCGFDNGARAMAGRRDEDRAALALLGAQPHWLGFLDDQYGAATPQTALVDALTALVHEFDADTLLLPLGLFHADHRRLADAALAAVTTVCAHADPPGLQAWAYEDVPYRAIPGLLQRRLAALLHAGWLATPVKRPARTPDPRKAAAIACYASQLRAFGAGGLDDPGRPERLWRLAREQGAGPEVPP